MNSVLVLKPLALDTCLQSTGGICNGIGIIGVQMLFPVPLVDVMDSFLVFFLFCCCFRFARR